MTVKNKKLRLAVFGVILISHMFLFASFAVAANVPDITKSGSLSVEIRKPDSGELYAEAATVRIFHIAGLTTDGNALGYAATEEYKSANVDFDALGSKSDTEIAALVPGLLDYIGRNRLSATDSVSGVTGKFTFSDLELGMYMVQYLSTENKLTVDAFIVFVPSQSTDRGDWFYELTVYPKYLAVKPYDPPPGPGREDPVPTPTFNLPDEEVPKDSTEADEPLEIPDSDTPVDVYESGDHDKPEKLPQTGMLRWPILILGIIGVGLFAFGWTRLFLKGADKRD